MAKNAKISVYCGESSPKFQMYNEQKTNGILTRENQNACNKSAENHKNITDLKLRPTVIEKRELRQVVRKRDKVPLYLYFYPQTSEL